MTLPRLIDSARNGGDSSTHDDHARVRAKLTARLLADAAAEPQAPRNLRRRVTTPLLLAAAVLAVGTASAFVGAKVLRDRAHVAALEAAPTTREAYVVPAPPSTPPAVSASSEPAQSTLPAQPAHARRPPSPAASAGALDAEMARIQEARDALRLRDPSAALAALSRYDAEFRRGVMKPEAAALRVLALCDAGRSTEARSRGVIFARQWPRSPLIVRVRASCAFDHEGGSSP